MRGAPGSEAALGSNYRQRSVAAQEAVALHGSPSRLRWLQRFTKPTELTGPAPKAKGPLPDLKHGRLLPTPVQAACCSIQARSRGGSRDEELRQHRQAKAASKGRTEDLSHRPESDFGGSNSRTAGAGSTAVCFQTDGQRKEKGDSGRAVKEEAKDRSHQNQRRPRRSPDYPLNPRPSQGKNIHQTAITGARTSTRMGGWESQEDEGAQQDAVADYF